MSLPQFSDEVRASLPNEAETFDQFESLRASWEPRFKKARNAARYEEERFRETGLITARRQATHLAAGTAVRILDLTAGLVAQVNAVTPHAAYAVARASFETAAVFAYVNRHLVPLLRKKRVERVEELLRRVRMGADPGLRIGREDQILPIRVSSLIGALCDQADQTITADDGKTAGETMRELYSMLSDHTHPNFSAGHLSSVLDNDQMMDWSTSLAWTPETIHDVIGVPHLALALAAPAFDDLLRGLTAHPLTLADKWRPPPRAATADRRDSP